MPTITGTSGADILLGGDDADVIIGLGGDDSLTGGAGDDILRGDEGNDRLDGGTGRDTADYSSATSAVRVDLRLSGPQDTGGAGLDTLISIESLVGSAFDDVLIASDAFNTLYGGAGADTLTSGGGADIFLYSSASESTAASQDVITDFFPVNDAFDFTALAPTEIRLVYLETFATQVFVESASGTLQLLVQGANVPGSSGFIYSTSAGLHITGSSRSESVQGGNRDDRLFGGDGNDTVFGSRGADLLTGGQGSDSFSFISALDSTAASSDTVMDFEVGRDSIDLSNMLVRSIAIGRLDNGDSVLFAQGRDGALQVLFRNVALTTANIAYQGFGATGFYLIGSNIADTFVGTTFGDSIVGMGGDDTLTGGTGADAIAGGAGRDTFRYAEGDSTQAAGLDNLYDFTTGEDRIDLTGVRVSSVSLVRQADGSSLLFAGPGGSITPPAVVVGATGRAINAGDLDYVALVGSNILAVTHSFGSALGDTLTGSARADALYGLEGNDVLSGGGGADVLWGGDGADVIAYAAVADSRVTGADTLFGFVTGQDRIDLRGVRTGSADTFGLAFQGGSTFVFVDLGGNGTNDMLIQVQNSTLSTADILWSAIAAAPASAMAQESVDGGTWPQDGSLTPLAGGAATGVPGLETPGSGLADWYL